MAMGRPLLALCAVLALGPAASAAGAQAPASRILVVPFESASAEPRLRWLGEACAVLLTDELNARGVRAITRAERIRAFDELHLPLSARARRISGLPDDLADIEADERGRSVGHVAQHVEGRLGCAGV